MPQGEDRAGGHPFRSSPCGQTNSEGYPLPPCPRALDARDQLAHGGRQADYMAAHGRRVRAASGQSEDPQRRGMVRLARHPDKDRLEGRGSGRQDALLALTVHLMGLTR